MKGDITLEALCLCQREFSKFGILVIWPVLERDSALSYKISR